MSRSLREGTRTDWTVPNERFEHEDVVDGCLLRIADAVEKIEETLRKEKGDLARYEEENKRLRRTIAALRRKK